MILTFASQDASPPNKAKDLKVTPEVHCDVKEILSFADDGRLC